ncbi:unnamed protein product [Ilex paraguariensis]|uniref:Uncharacterized protein n=1 Tax=Ilex paraguariensis TaxID=185542 RepID=A0ABC8QYW0_9AQUA
MGSFIKPWMFLLLLLVISFKCQSTRVAEAASPVALLPKQRYSKIFETLGVVCKCCDGAGGECRSIWVGSCSKLHCIPWKLQH